MTSTTRAVGVFGGSFDPPHLGHQQVAKALIESKIVDEVWFVPVKQHPLGKNVSSEQHRVAMLELLLKSTLPGPEYKLEPIELHSEGPSYSLKTLTQLSQLHPDINFSWIMGSDNLSAFDTWWHYEELLRTFPLFVYPREGYPPSPWYTEMSWLENVPTIAISSTQIRQNVQQNQPVTQLVGDEIAKYIKNHGLYR